MVDVISMMAAKSPVDAVGVARFICQKLGGRQDYLVFVSPPPQKGCEAVIAIVSRVWVKRNEFILLTAEPMAEYMYE